MSRINMSAAPDVEDAVIALIDEAHAPEPPRRLMRSRRKRAVRAKVENLSRLSKATMRAASLEYPEPTAHLRPQTRGDCVDGHRPCPFVSCKFNLYLDVSENGSIKYNFPDIDGPENMPVMMSCALDIADRGGETLELVGEAANITRERVRQVEVKALAQVQALDQLLTLRDWVEDDTRKVVRRLPVIDTRFLDDEPETCSEEEIDE